LLGTVLLSTNTTNPTLNMSSNADVGNFVVDGLGLSLYMFQPDMAMNSTCYGACAVNWPPYTVTSGVVPKAGPGINATLIGTKARTDGTTIVTYGGWPLYYYKADLLTIGLITGQGKGSAGNLWFVLSPNGKVNSLLKGRPANKATNNTLELKTSSVYGQYLVDSTGATLYSYEKDTFVMPNCYSTCAQAFPPYTINSTDFPTFGTGVDGTLVYKVTRTDGTDQVTYNGYPLYYNSTEKTMPGLIGSQNMNSNGGMWWILKPSGDQNKSPNSNVPIGSSSFFLTISSMLLFGISLIF